MTPQRPDRSRGPSLWLADRQICVSTYVQTTVGASAFPSLKMTVTVALPPASTPAGVGVEKFGAPCGVTPRASGKVPPYLSRNWMPRRLTLPCFQDARGVSTRGAGDVDRRRGRHSRSRDTNATMIPVRESTNARLHRRTTHLFFFRGKHGRYRQCDQFPEAANTRPRSILVHGESAKSPRDFQKRPEMTRTVGHCFRRSCRTSAASPQVTERHADFLFKS